MQYEIKGKDSHLEFAVGVIYYDFITYNWVGQRILYKRISTSHVPSQKTERERER